MSGASIKPSPKSAAPPANFASSAATPPLASRAARSNLLHKNSPANERGRRFHRPFSLPRCFFAPLLHSLAVAALRVPHPACIGNVVLHSPQPPSKPLRQLMPCTPQPRLQRVLGNSEFLRSLARGIPLHFAQHKRRSKQRRKLVQILADHFPNFRARKHLLGIRSVIRKALRCRQLILARRFVQRNRWTRLRTPPPHQRRVDHDARQPRRKLRAALEPLQISVRREHSVLQRVFRVFRVSQHPQRRLKQRPLVTPEESFHRLVVAPLSSADQFVFGQLRSYCYLRCHRLPPIQSENSLQNPSARRNVPPCTGTVPAAARGFLISSKTGISAKNTTPSTLKLSINASITACRCTVL